MTNLETAFFLLLMISFITNLAGFDYLRKENRALKYKNDLYKDLIKSSSDDMKKDRSKNEK